MISPSVRAVGRHRLQRRGVGDLHLGQGRVAHALARHQAGALGERQLRPVRLLDADRGRAVALGQAVEMGDAEAHRAPWPRSPRWAARRRRSRPRRSGRSAPHLGRRVDQHVEHDRRAAQMGDAAPPRSAGRSPPGRPGAGRHGCRRPRSPPRCRSSRCSGTSAASRDRRSRLSARTRARCPARSGRRRGGGRRRPSGCRWCPRCSRARSRPIRRPGGCPGEGRDRPRPAAPRSRRRRAARPGLPDRRCRPRAAGARICASAASTTGANSLSASSTLASPCSRMKAIEAASSRVLSAFSTAPAIGTP